MLSFGRERVAGFARLGKSMLLGSELSWQIFDLAKVKSLSRDLFGRRHDGVGIWPDKIAESLCTGDDIFEYVLLFRLEWQARKLAMPVL